VAASTVTSVAQTNSISTNGMTASFIMPTYEPSIHLEHTWQSKTVAAKFLRNFMLSDTFVNRLGRPQELNFVLHQQDGHGYTEYLNTAGRNAFARALVYSARDTAVEHFPLESYQNDWEQIGWRFIRGTVGNTAESQIQPVGIQYIASDYSFLEGTRNDGKIDYGIRPFGTSPYAYASFKFDDSLYLYARYHYTLFGRDSFELQATVPLRNRYELVFGASIDPLRLHDPESQTVSCQLRHSVDRSMFVDYFTAGLFANKNGWSVGASASKTF
jgi:hypothetical protein